MVLYPVNLKVGGRLCVVVGGGKVAARKVASLLECGARVRVVSPALDEEFGRLTGSFERLERPYEAGDLEEAFLAIAATDDEETNRAVEAEAGQLNILLNVVDKPEQCNFYVPSSVRRGDLLITVSTGGRLPALSKRLRRRMEEEYPWEWEPVLELLGQARDMVITRIEDEGKKRQCLSELAGLELVPVLKRGGEDAVKAEIDKCISRYLA